MKTTDFNQQTTSHKLNENLYKKFGVKVDFNKYSREQLEDARNKIRTEIHQLEAKSNFNDLLTNETYQKNKQLVGLLNTRIKEMLGESIRVMERKLSGVKPDYIDADGDGNKKEPMKKAFKDKKVKEGFPTVADAKARHEKEKTTGKFDSKKTSTGTVYTKKHTKADAADHSSEKKVKEAFPTVASATADAEKKKTTGKFDVKKTATGTQYTRKASTFTDGGDDSDVKKAKKSAKANEGTKNLPGNQEKIDVDHDGKIEKSDLAKLRAGKKKMKESQHKQNVKVVNESIRRLLAEDEEGKAKAITAGTDMVNDFTSWMTRVGQYQTKSMIELADAIRANMGQEQAETFKGAVAPALETALNTLTQAREQLSNAVAVLAGESSPMDTMGADMGADMGGAEPGMDSMNAGNEEVPMDDEFGAADAAAGGAEMAGREMRESRKLFAAKLNEAHSIIARLSK